ncbi:MAG: hypothetical protein WAN65_29510 [Candidatus Sulfotelmatobacter sp.]
MGIVTLRRSREILGTAHEKSDPLWRSCASDVQAKFVAAVDFTSNVDEDEVVQIGTPPTSRLDDIGCAVNLDAKFTHDIGSQVAFGLRGIKQ